MEEYLTGEFSEPGAAIPDQVLSGEEVTLIARGCFDASSFTLILEWDGPAQTIGDVRWPAKIVKET